MNIKGKKLSLLSIFAIVTAVLAFGYVMINAIYLSWCAVGDITGFNYGTFIENIKPNFSDILVACTAIFNMTTVESVLAEITVDAFVVFALFFIFESMGKKKEWMFGIAAFIYAVFFIVKLPNAYETIENLWYLLSYNSYDSVTITRISIGSYIDIAYSIIVSIYGFGACVLLMLHGFGVLKKKLFPLIGSSVLVGVTAIGAIYPVMETVSLIGVLKFAFEIKSAATIIRYVLLTFEWLAGLIFAGAQLAFAIVLLLRFIKEFKAEKQEAKQASMESIRIINDCAEEAPVIEETDATEEQTEGAEESATETEEE